MKSGGDDATDSKAMSPVLMGPGDADAARMSFTLNGRAFIAVPASQWTASQYRSSNGARLHVVGYVRLAGVRHVLIEQDIVEDAPQCTSPVSSVLTSRELQIAYSVAEGKCDKVIAYELGISEYTVREHMRRIFHKLKVSKRAALVAQLITARFLTIFVTPVFDVFDDLLSCLVF
jgi:DNA-binding NarL/FixJ family response regulator